MQSAKDLQKKIWEKLNIHSILIGESLKVSKDDFDIVGKYLLDTDNITEHNKPNITIFSE